jgi:hypothetical protein
MPRSGGIFTLVPSYLAVSGQTIEVENHNPPLEDIAQALTDSLPRDGSAPMTGNLSMGGSKVTGLAAATAPGDAVRFEQIGVPITALNALTPAADRVPYFTGPTTAALATFTAAGRALVDDADAAAQRTTLGLGSLATLSSITTTQIAAATLVTESEGIASNDNDTTIPTSAAVKDYADTKGTTFGTPVASTSGTNVDFSSIPATAKRVRVILSGVSWGVGAALRFQIGDSGGFETTGYIGTSSAQNASSNTFAAASAGFETTATILSGDTISGAITFSNIAGNTWVADGVFAISGGQTLTVVMAGTKTLSDVLDRVRVTSAAGATFDAGTVNVSWE